MRVTPPRPSAGVVFKWDCLKKTKNSLTIGDKVKTRIIAISFNELNPRESKIGLTMRQPALGKEEWLKEKKEENKQKMKKEEKKD